LLKDDLNFFNTKNTAAEFFGGGKEICFLIFFKKIISILKNYFSAKEVN
jgi:hypothetical protein